MKVIEALFQVTTPMFMAGYDQNKAEFRIPSLLGALRFWYRATAPQEYINNISAFKTAEAGLFGSIKTGQGKFLVRADTSKVATGEATKARWGSDYGISYLGYGPISFKGVNRNYINQDSIIKVKFIFRQCANESDIAGLLRAVKALTLFGGLGSRSRKGFGSVTLLKLYDENKVKLWEIPRSQKELRTEIKNYIDSLKIAEINTEEMLPYTAFSSMSRILVTKAEKSPFTLLDQIGREMIRYRSYGSSNKGASHKLPWNEESEQIFADDHDLMINFNADCKTHPRRVAFGLPHNYYFGSTKRKVEIKGSMSERRASPLFIHIHALADEGYAAVLTYLPAQFLPADEKIEIKVNRQKPVPVPCRFDGKVITNFMARFHEAAEVEI